MLKDKVPKEGDECEMPNGDMGHMEMDDNGDMKCMPGKAKDVDNEKKISCKIAVDKAAGLPYGQVEFIVSTPSEDRDGEKILLEGIDTKYYNGTVLYGHDYSSLPIGKSIKIWKDKAVNALKARVQFAVNELPFAKNVYDLIMGGYLTDASIGGIVKTWNEDYTVIEELEMMEWSVVPIGSNRDAGVLAKAIGKTEEQFKKDYEDSVIKVLSKKIEGKGIEELGIWVKNLKEITAALEGEVDGISEASAQSPSGKVKIKLAMKKAKEADIASENIIKTLKIRLKTGKE